MQQCILIYDDDLEILSVGKIILEKQGYLVETRPRCDNIIKDITKLNPLIILMDIWIPGMGGEKATQLIKKNKTTRHIPVILFSANSEIENICERVHADAFLKKPFEISALTQIVKNHILTHGTGVTK